LQEKGDAQCQGSALEIGEGGRRRERTRGKPIASKSEDLACSNGDLRREIGAAWRRLSSRKRERKREEVRGFIGGELAWERG
jgi:hypothetical protein